LDVIETILYKGCQRRFWT